MSNVVQVNFNAQEGSNNEAISSTDTAADIKNQPTVYDFLVQHGNLDKLTRITIKQASVEPHLMEDITQEIHLIWCSAKVNTNFQFNQICAYAVRIGRCAALAARRELSAVTRLPSAAFSSARGEAHQGLLDGIGAYTSPTDIADYADSISSDDEGYEQTLLTEMQCATLLRSVRMLPVQAKLVRLLAVEGVAPEDMPARLNTSPTMYARHLSSIRQLMQEWHAAGARCKPILAA